jgi:hypothetical protein
MASFLVKATQKLDDLDKTIDKVLEQYFFPGIYLE